MNEPPILKFFAFEHLPFHLQQVSKPIGELAREMAASLPPSAELSAGLRKLLKPPSECRVAGAFAGRRDQPRVSRWRGR